MSRLSLYIFIIIVILFFLCQFSRRNVLGMTQFASAKKSKESEPFVSFLPRLVLEPGLLLNFSATALRNSVVRILWLVCFVSVTQAWSFQNIRLFIPGD